MANLVLLLLYSRPDRIEVSQIQCSKLFKVMGCAPYMVLYVIKNPLSRSIRAGHIVPTSSSSCHDCAESDIKQ